MRRFPLSRLSRDALGAHALGSVARAVEGLAERLERGSVGPRVVRGAALAVVGQALAPEEDEVLDVDACRGCPRTRTRSRPQSRRSRPTGRCPRRHMDGHWRCRMPPLLLRRCSGLAPGSYTTYPRRLPRRRSPQRCRSAAAAPRSGRPWRVEAAPRALATAVARARRRSARRLPTAAASAARVGRVRRVAGRRGRREAASRATCARLVGLDPITKLT